MEIREKASPSIRNYFDRTLKIFTEEKLTEHVQVDEKGSGRIKYDESFESMVAYGQSEITVLEGYVINDPILTNEEKLSVLSSTSYLYYLLPTMVDQGSGGGYGGDPYAQPRVAGWDWLKKVVNAIVTVVVHVVEGIFSPLTLGVAAFLGGIIGPFGLVAGAAAGAVLGFGQGLQCVTQATSTYNSCYTCVFGTSDSNDPCYAP